MYAVLLLNTWDKNSLFFL